MKLECPPQIVVGGDTAAKIWKKWILPLLKTDLSTRDIGLLLGVSHTTVARWRRYL